MDGDMIHSELINLGDAQNDTYAEIKKNTKMLESISEKVSEEQTPPVVNVPDTVEVNNFPEVQKVEVTNPVDAVDLNTVEGLLLDIIELIPSIKDDRSPEAITKLAESILKDRSNDKVIELLRAILDKEEKSFEIPDDLKSKEGRIKVEVDRVGSFSGAGMLNTVDFTNKQNELIAAVNSIGGAGTYIKKVDEDGTYLYVGEAVPGTADTDSLWRIQRIDLTNDPDIVILWAGTSFSNQWSNRTGLTYA